MRAVLRVGQARVPGDQPAHRVRRRWRRHVRAGDRRGGVRRRTASPPPPVATATTGYSTVPRPTSPASTSPATCWWWPEPRTRPPAPSSRCSLSCPPTPPGWSTPRSRWISSAPIGSSACFSMTSGCPPTRWWAPRTRRSTSCLRGSTRNGSWPRRLRSAWLATRSGWPPSTRRSGWCGATNRSDPIKALRTRSRRPTSRCNWRS